MVEGDGGPGHERAPMSLRMVAVPALMVAVAALGTWRYHNDHQTAWRGATVGMFAMVDAPANRLVRGVVEQVDDRGDEPDLYMPPPEVADERMRALVTPTTDNLESLAEAWAPVVTDGRLVRVEVWATRFRSGPGTPSVRLELIGSHDVVTGADGGADGGAGQEGDG